MYQMKFITQNIQTVSSDRSKRTWTQDEQDKFKSLYKQFKKDFIKYVPYFEGRSEGQIKSFYQNVVHNNKQIQKSRESYDKTNLIELTPDRNNEGFIQKQINESSKYQRTTGLSLIVFDTVDFSKM
ncbi:SANT/Myb_domain [Hexamita inflata]|uniref:SANT/Myb domain n=1 Tax=Hexamita inflata TaxID=28002 RepID=A0AA86QJL0_9EUKA|nr:SANT/Myb domain [Hexamita inflata]